MKVIEYSFITRLLLYRAVVYINLERDHLWVNDDYSSNCYPWCKHSSRFILVEERRGCIVLRMNPDHDINTNTCGMKKELYTEG